MSTLKNQVQLIGNLGDTPKIIEFDNNSKVANFSLATNDTYKDAAGNKVTDTQWHNCNAWGKLADVVQNHLNKGDEILVKGRIAYREFEDKEGNKRKITEIIIEELLMLNTKNKE